MTETALLEMSSDAPDQPSYSRLRDLIRADIVLGKLPSGSRLKIGDLAARYSSSGIPVREALQQLQGEGIVTFEPNRGARVRQIDAAFLRDIHEVRAVMEPFLIRWFVRHRSEEQLARLEAAQRDYDQAITEGFEQFGAKNRLFHNICYDGHYNVEALAVAARHNALIVAIAGRFQPTRARALQASREHWAIIEKIRQQDEDGAAAIVAEHVRHAGQHLIERVLVAGRQERQIPSHLEGAATGTTGAMAEV